MTDFASIPRGLWNILPPTGEYGKAAVLHDWLYCTGGLDNWARANRFTRAQCDRIFLEAMTILGVCPWKRRLMWLAVRAFGRGAFRT
jgi:hypothetical protein